jgi:uncharacterized RDD family membrane protein YckC
MATVKPRAGGSNVHRQGNYAGAISRVVGLALDVGVLWGLYVLGYFAVALAFGIFTGHSLSSVNHRTLDSIILVAWGFLYYTYQWSLNGKTVGMALLGLQLVRTDGAPVGVRQAAIRTVILPFSVLILGIGLFIGVVQRERRTLQDLGAGTVVVYDWDARAARLRWLAKSDKHHPVPGPPALTGPGRKETD